MAGINLSQSVAPKRTVKRSFFDNSFIWVVIFTIVVLALWGGLRFLIYTADQKMAGLQSQIDASGTSLQGESVDRVTNVANRMTKLEGYETASEEIRKATDTLEGLTLPSVQLDKFEYNPDGGSASISGTADTFRNLGQQVINYKSSELFPNITVENVSTTEDGRVGFTLSVALEKPEEVQANTEPAPPLVPPGS